MIALLAMVAAARWPLGSSDVASLEKGGYETRDFQDGDARGMSVRFFVKAPLHECYDILADVKDMPQYMPGLNRIRVLSATGDTKILQYHSGIPLIPDFVLARHFEPDKSITWSKIKAPYKRIDGSWRFQALPDGTVLTYTAEIDTGQVLVPSWLAIAIEQQGRSQLVHNVRRRIESGGTWVRPDYHK